MFFQINNLIQMLVFTFPKKFNQNSIYIAIESDKFVKQNPAVVIFAASSLKFFQPERKSTLSQQT